MLKNPSERDRQRKVGASQISQPCDYCLANALTGGGHQEPSRWWLGARLGTAIHETLEKEEYANVDKPKSYHFEALEGALIEERITLGTISGYGTIGSKPDLVLTKYNHLVDHKTTTRDKLKKYKLDGVPIAYVYQTQLYAWGLNKSGVKIESITLNFICRDGSTDDDVWTYTFPYDEALALKAWERLDLIWRYITDNNNLKNPSTKLIDTLESHPDCFKCNMNGRI